MIQNGEQAQAAVIDEADTNYSSSSGDSETFFDSDYEDGPNFRFFRERTNR